MRTVYRHSCKFCDSNVDAESIEDITRQGRAHLEEQHFGELEAMFEDEYDWTCQGDCSNEFPVGDDTGFDCPECGHDNFPDFADRYVWWQIQIG